MAVKYIKIALQSQMLPIPIGPNFFQFPISESVHHYHPFVQSVKNINNKQTSFNFWKLFLSFTML